MSLLFTFSLLLFTSAANVALADTVNYYDPVSKTTKTAYDVIPVTGDTGTFEDGKWYVVKGIVERGTITVNGSANLILTDGAKLTVAGGDNQAGVNVSGKNSLTIWGQFFGTGELVANGGWYGTGELVANGGWYGAGIGGGESGSGGNVTINGGTVTATGNSDGAGIGGGDGGAGGTVTINGGTVMAQGGNNGAGIGGGDEGAGGDVTINGGRVSALGGGAGAGIGKGNLGGWGKTRIDGGTVEARSGETWPDHPFGNSTVIDGGSVMAVDNNGESAVTNSANAAVYCVTVEIETMNVEKLRVEGFADYGTQDIYPIDGKVYLWLPNGEYLFSINDQWYGVDVNGAATVATPTRRPAFVTVTSAKQRWPWNGKVDVGYALSNTYEDEHYRIITSVTAGGTTRQVTNEVGQVTDGGYTITVDCDALFGPGVLAPASLTMAVMATKPNWAADPVIFTLDTLAERTIDLSAGVTTTNLTCSGDNWGEPGAGTSATIKYRIGEGDETTLADGLTGTGETEWMLCTNATFVLTHTSGTATETATITLANLPMVTITVGDLAAKHLTGKVVWNGVETLVTGVSFKLPKGGTGAKLVLTAEQGFRLQSGYGVTIDLDDYLATGAPVSVDIEGAAAFSRVATKQYISLDQGWNSIHIQVAETNDVDTLFRDWPVEWVALYDPSEPLSSYGSDEGTSRAGYRMWRRSEPGLSQFRYVPAESVLVCYASGPHICTFRGEPCAPRITWHKSNVDENLNVVGFSTWDETTTKSYFSGLDVGDAVFYQFGGDNADKPMVSPVMIAGALTFDNGQVLAVSSTKVSDWSGVLNVSPRNGLDFGTNARNRTLEVRNDGASRTVVTVKMKSDGVSYNNCDPMPQCLVVRDSFDAITNGPWTAFGLGTTLRRELLPGETWKIAFSIDILGLEEGKFYGAILDIRDETPDGSNMRVNVPLKAVRTGEVSSGSVELLGVTNRYPWNGKIDVAASVTDLDPTRYYRLITSVTLGGTTKRVGRELGLGRDATFMNTVDCAVLFGSNAVGQASVSLSLKAYAAAESPVDVVSDGTPQLMEGEYLIIDLTKTGSESYEETTLGEYLADHRDAWTLGGGWADIYKTRYLVMRKVPRWKKYPCEPRSVGMTTQTMIPKRDYWIGVHQVTKAQYERVMNGNDSDSDDAKPKTDISWNDIRGDADILTGITNEVCFMRRLCRRTGLAGFDLPTEVQWEIAARAGSREPYGAYVDANGYLRTATAGDLTSVAWYAANSLDVFGIVEAVKKVAQLRPNLWGLYDTAGNVSEWCRDGFGSFDRQDVETPSAESSVNSGFRVVRGGFCGGTADFCRPSVRSSASADSGSLYVGFRVMGVCEREDPNGDVENE